MSAAKFLCFQEWFSYAFVACCTKLNIKDTNNATFL